LRDDPSIIPGLVTFAEPLANRQVRLLIRLLDGRSVRGVVLGSVASFESRLVLVSIAQQSLTETGYYSRPKVLRECELFRK